MRIVYQTRENDCALACLAMMLGHHGRTVSLYDLKMRHPIGAAGVSVYDLKVIAGYRLGCCGSMAVRMIWVACRRPSSRTGAAVIS